MNTLDKIAETEIQTKELHNGQMRKSSPFELLVIQQITLKQAREFVYNNHRHHSPPQGHKFSIGCFINNNLVGIASIGRPISRCLDDGTTLEITRLCTNGTKNACSKLYSSSARIAKEFGYKKIITYILQSESGISLKASGWRLDEICKGNTLDKSKNRNRTNVIIDLFGTKKKYSDEPKQRWCKILAV